MKKTCTGLAVIIYELDIIILYDVQDKVHLSLMSTVDLSEVSSSLSSSYVNRWPLPVWVEGSSSSLSHLPRCRITHPSYFKVLNKSLTNNVRSQRVCHLTYFAAIRGHSQPHLLHIVRDDEVLVQVKKTGRSHLLLWFPRFPDVLFTRYMRIWCTVICGLLLHMCLWVHHFV